MSDIAIKVEGLAKVYKIGAPKSSSLRESIARKFSFLTHRKDEANTTDYWALKDVSFEIKRGEAVGIIGKNGAGKSTLLKILSRITQPAKGRIEINGRVASLLEVGTGFHPELSGRENIFLNGTILGMTRREIKARFDEIVNFSGVEKFIDTPVKFYSSGMYVRLAFAVAAHLEPEILIIDEVLAVGDAEFQKKCLGKMSEVAGQGRTVIFVSHNMAAVKNLCSKGILLNKGQIVSVGEVKYVIDSYLENVSKSASVFELAPPKIEPLLGLAHTVVIEDEFGNPCLSLPLGKPYQIKVMVKIFKKLPHFIAGLGFMTPEDVAVRTVWSQPQDLLPGEYEFSFREDNVFFASGKYKVAIGLSSREQTIHYVDDCVFLEFDNYVDKSIALRSNQGLILNQMKVTCSKLEVTPI